MEAEERRGPPREAPPWVHRSHDLSRVLALSDGVFAFAMTLLVLGIAVPTLSSDGAIRGYLESRAFLQALFGYLISFFVISQWWQGHQLIFRYIRQYDRTLLRLNILFLVFIAIVPFSTSILNGASNDPVGIALFSLIQVGAGLSLSGVWLYAVGRGRLTREALPENWRRYVTLSVLATPAVFAISIVVGFVDTTVAEILWFGIFAVPLIGRRKLAGSGPADSAGNGPSST